MVFPNPSLSKFSPDHYSKIESHANTSQSFKRKRAINLVWVNNCFSIWEKIRGAVVICNNY